MNYESTNVTLPPAACSSLDYTKSGLYYRDNFSSFVRLLPYTEQAPMYNAVNFNMTYANQENFTIAGVQLSVLVCPSDTNITPQAMNTANGYHSNYDGITPTTSNLAYFSSYSGSQGTFWSNYYIGAKGGTQVQSQQNGAIIIDGNVRISSITDGTSNTMIYGEKAHGYFAVYDKMYQNCDTVWSSGLYFDTMFTTTYPPNLPSTSASRTFAQRKHQLRVLFRDRRDKLPPGWAEYRVLRRLGPFHQEYDQLVDVYYWSSG